MADPTERRRAVSGSERSTRTIVKRVLSASIVIVVLALVAIGAGRVANSGPDETLASSGIGRGGDANGDADPHRDAVTDPARGRVVR